MKSLRVRRKTTKVCSGCEREMPATADYFARRSDSQDGLDGRCLKCHRAAYHERRAREQQEAERAAEKLIAATPARTKAVGATPLTVVRSTDVTGPAMTGHRKELCRWTTLCR